MIGNRTATTLDTLLYAWLAEPDDRRFDRAFASYFSVAFPAVLRHLSRLSRWDPANVEELAQDALLRFFEKAGKGRREASDLVRSTLPTIRPLNMGPFHQRQVMSWTQDAESFRTAAMSFRPAINADAAESGFKEPIRSLAARIPPLQARGSHLLRSVCADLQWDSGPASTADFLDFVQCFAAETDSPSARQAEQKRPGVTSFVDGTATVVSTLPALRVPTNGYLFEMALTIYLDECKKRGRQKRGGSGFKDAGDRIGATDGPHPLDRLGAEFDSEPGVRDVYGLEPSVTAVGVASNTPQEPSVDPMRQFEDQEFFEKFYAYLRKPLDAASVDYERAREQGRAAAELKKVASTSNKFARTVAVLSLMGEGYTQEQAAERLDLSRNQVKYIIELVQEAFGSFSQSSGDYAARHAHEGVRPHG